MFSSHILSDVERVADRIGVLAGGVLRVDCPTDHFKRSVRKVVLGFDCEPPKFPACQGLVSSRAVGNDLELVVVDYSEAHQQAAEALNPRSIEVVDLNLEEAFIEYTRGPRRRLPIFAGEEPDDQSIGNQGAA